MKEGGVKRQATCMGETRNVYRIVFSKPTRKKKKMFEGLATCRRVMLRSVS